MKTKNMNRIHTEYLGYFERGNKTKLMSAKQQKSAFHLTQNETKKRKIAMFLLLC